MKVVELEQFEKLGQRLVSALSDVAGQAIPLSLSQVLDEVMKQRGLMYPEVILSMEMSTLQEIPPP